MPERLSLAEATEVTEKKMEKPISGKTCKLVKSESDGMPLKLIGDLTKKDLCVLSELCKRPKLIRMIN